MGKPFLTQEEQLNLLKNVKRLRIDNPEKAISVLKEINYYRLNAYFHQFLVDDKFVEGCTFDQILDVYEADRVLRRFLVEYLEKIEIKARCQIGHVLGKTYGPDAFFYASNFKDIIEWENLQSTFVKSSSRDKNDPVANHYYNEKNGEFEIWVVVEYLSFGELSRLFGICDTRIQAEIASSFGVHETLLKSWLESLSILRNVCAHYGYLRRRIFPTSPAIPKSLKDSLGNNKRIFSHVLAIDWLIDKRDRVQLGERLQGLQLDWREYGFPENWLLLLNN